jgi:hypothetical protein
MFGHSWNALARGGTAETAEPPNGGGTRDLGDVLPLDAHRASSRVVDGEAMLSAKDVAAELGRLRDDDGTPLDSIYPLLAGMAGAFRGGKRRSWLVPRIAFEEWKKQGGSR